MDRLALARKLVSSYNDEEEWDTHDKVGNVALLLLALEVRVDEEQWREFLLVAGLDIYDSVISGQCRDATNMCYLSGILNMKIDSDSSWVDLSHPLALYVMTDEEYIACLREIDEQVKAVRATYAQFI